MPEKIFRRSEELERLFQRALENLVPMNALLPLREDGITGCTLVAVGLIGAARVSFNGNRFDFDPNGTPAWILASHGGVDGEIDDLVAFGRQRMATLDGRIWGLGSVDPCGPTPVRRTVLDWLKQGGDGIVVFNWRMATDYFITQEAVLEAEDDAHRQFIVGQLVPPRVPKVVVRQRPSFDPKEAAE